MSYNPWSEPEPPPPPPRPRIPADIDTELQNNTKLHGEVATLLRRARAREILAELKALENPQPPPDAALLGELLDRPVSTRWRIEGLLPATGRLLWAAQRKAGKTTATGNLARSLLTGEPFLGRYEVTKLDGRVAALNYEMSGEKYARWMADIGVPRDRLFVVNLRGRRNLLSDEAGRQELAQLVRAHDCEVLVVDPFGRAYTGKSQNDVAEVTPWLVRLDEVAEQAGCAELILTAHAGWDGERTRGSSGLEDWPDVIVTMTKDADSGARFLKAEGRDVDLEEDQLLYDPRTRRLTLTGAGNRQKVRGEQRIERLALIVADIVEEKPGSNTTEVAAALREGDQHMQREDPGKACRLAVANGLVERVRGPRNSWLHYPPGKVPDPPEAPAKSHPQTPVVPSLPEHSQGTLVSIPDPPYRGGTTDCTADGPSSPGTTTPATAPASP